MADFVQSLRSPMRLNGYSSRARVLTAPPLLFGPDTESIRASAVVSVLSIPIAQRTQLQSASVPSAGADAPLGVRQSAKDAAVSLLPLLPESCFIAMAGGKEAYEATPITERQQANFRTLCKAVGRSGDTGTKLQGYIEKLLEYRRIRGVTGPMWPLYPCILSNFAVWLQLHSPKENATSVAPRCISAFVSASKNICLPVFIDSPHLGAVPAHQASGDGWTGFMPLDIVSAIERLTGPSSSQGLRFDACAAYTIWEGSCRTADWVQVSPADKSLAPSAAAVYRIAITKNGERNTLFAVGYETISGSNLWRSWFDEQLVEFGSSPALTTGDYFDATCRPIQSSKLESKAFADRLFKLILLCAKSCGYTAAQLKLLHVHVHALHGSFAAYAEAMEWDTVPVHRLGRWKLPSSQASIVPVRQRRGAGRGGAKSIPAVYSTAAACQIQLLLRCRMIAAIRELRGAYSTHGDLSCFINNRNLVEQGFRGPHGHETPLLRAEIAD
jgi:hypothetical protein